MNKNDGLTQTKSHFTPIKEIIISLSLVFIPMLVILFFINSFSASKMKTAESLKKSGYDVVLTRDGDYAVYSEEARTLREKKVSDIHNRFAIIEDSGDCIFVSIHMNHFDSAYVCGAQTFYSGNNPESKKLADSVQSTIKTLVQPENERVTKKATSSIYLLYYAQVPAIMVECGFISNENEAAKLQTTEYQNQMAAAIAEGINHYCNGLQ